MAVGAVTVPASLTPAPAASAPAASERLNTLTSVMATRGATEIRRTACGWTPVMPLTPPKYSTPSAPAAAELTAKPSVRPSAVEKRLTLPVAGSMRTSPPAVLSHSMPARSLRMARILTAPTLSAP